MTWYYIKKQDCENWHSLPGQGEEFLGDCCTAGELLQPLKSKTTHAEFYYNGKLTESYLDFLSGMTCVHSMDIHGVDALTSSPVDSPVRISVQQERGKESKENGPAYGKKWRELSVRYDRHTHSWKTHRCLFHEVLQPCSVILPKWGMMQDGVLLEVEKPVDLLKVKGCGYTLPRPLSMDHMKWIPWEKRQILKSTYGCHVSSLPYYLIKNFGIVPSADVSNFAMGWPLSWTKLEPLGTDKFLQWLHSHGIFSADEQNKKEQNDN